MVVRLPQPAIARNLSAALLIFTAFSAAPGTAQPPSPTLTTLYTFTGGSDGESPLAALLTGKGGVLYGTTYQGGTWNEGTVYSLTPPAAPGGTWTETVIYSFAGTATGDGSYPEGGVVVGKDGVLYGTTYYGGTGAACTNGCGTIYLLTPSASPGGAWTE